MFSFLMSNMAGIFKYNPCKISLLRPSIIFNSVKVSNVEHFENDVTMFFFSCIIPINSLDLLHFISLKSYNFIF